jgi:hypothetical protein
MTVAAPSTPVRVVRRPVRGALAGLLLGLGVALVLVSFSVIALGTLAPLVVIVVGLVVGLLLATVVPARGAAVAGSPPEAPSGEPSAGTF